MVVNRKSECFSELSCTVLCALEHTVFVYGHSSDCKCRSMQLQQILHNLM